MSKPCSNCDRVHGSDEVRVYGTRFSDAPKRYIAQVPNAEPRDTREEAARDLCDHYRLIK